MSIYWSSSMQFKKLAKVFLSVAYILLVGSTLTITFLYLDVSFAFITLLVLWHNKKIHVRIVLDEISLYT